MFWTGPVLTVSPAQNVVSIQAFLIVIAIPLLVLAAVIREREHAQQETRENEERLNLAMGAGQVRAWEWRIADNRVIWSPRSRQIFGVADTNREFTFEEFLDVVVPEDRGALAQKIFDAILNGTAYQCEFRVTRADSTIAWILGKGKALYDDAGRPRRLLGVNVDVTEKKSAESLRREDASLRESEAHLRQLADAMPQIVWTATPDGRVDYLNQRWEALTGAGLDTSKNDGWLLMVHPDDRADTIRTWRQAVATGRPCEIENRLRVGDTGEFRWHLTRGIPVRDNSGEVLRWYGSSTDISDQKRVEQELRDAREDLGLRVEERTLELSNAVVQLRREIADRIVVEEALRSSEERFAKAFHSSPDALVIARRSDYRLIEVNEKWEAMFGYSRTGTRPLLRRPRPHPAGGSVHRQGAARQH
jgi:PAS domain S-box-containing protein